MNFFRRITSSSSGSSERTEKDDEEDPPLSLKGKTKEHSEEERQKLADFLRNSRRMVGLLQQPVPPTGQRITSVLSCAPDWSVIRSLKLSGSTTTTVEVKSHLRTTRT